MKNLITLNYETLQTKKNSKNKSTFITTIFELNNGDFIKRNRFDCLRTRNNVFKNQSN